MNHHAQCNDPQCMLNHVHAYMKNMVIGITHELSGTEIHNALRFKCYMMTIHWMWDYFGVEERKQTNYCSESCTIQKKMQCMLIM